HRNTPKTPNKPAPSSAFPTRLTSQETANQLPAKTKVWTLGTHQTINGNGDTGTGYQMYYTGVDWAVSDRLQFGVTTQVYDDPPYENVLGKGPNLTFASLAGSAKYQLKKNDKFAMSLMGAVEQFYSSNAWLFQVSPPGYEGERATSKIVGSIQVPMTFQTSKSLQLHLTPGIFFFPDTVKTADAYGTFVNLGFGASWKPGDRLTLSANGNLPIGPGGNATRPDDGSTTKRFVWSLGAEVAVTPRFAVTAYASNAWGVTPTTSVLAFQPEGQRLVLGANLKYVFDRAGRYAGTFREGPLVKPSDRDKAFRVEGLTLSSASTIPVDAVRVTAGATSGSSRHLGVTYGLASNLQLDLYFDRYSEGGLEGRFGGGTELKGGIGLKLQLMDHVQGDPISASLRVLGYRDFRALRKADKSTEGFGVGTLGVELPLLFQFSEKTAFYAVPKLAANGAERRYGIGIGANYNWTKNWQAIAEVTPVFIKGGDRDLTWALGLRYFNPNKRLGGDLFVSNSIGFQGLGAMVADEGLNFGFKLHWLTPGF
ncbi:MAG: hypothetical protein HC860_25295, partial [Alkalinema sp. RU_4_3]|nr:hypothetical protein [Alkalinema sp. RU_4_3]